ncbi:MAG: RrF2 family transcriptional regulator [Candidatus Zipacnadales bacterium]
MRTALRMSEATALALHVMMLLARKTKRRLSCNEMAETLGVSEAHLSKVLQRLGKQGFVASIRGPQGGFWLAREASEISLLDVCETIEGPLQFSHCLFEKPVCKGKQEATPCIMGNLLRIVDEQVLSYLQGTTLADLATISPSTKGKQGTIYV